jgi:hypothetical protein
MLPTNRFAKRYLTNITVSPRCISLEDLSIHVSEPCDHYNVYSRDNVMHTEHRVTTPNNMHVCTIRIYHYTSYANGYSEVFSKDEKTLRGFGFAQGIDLLDRIHDYNERSRV